jgi:hypothetical protein
MLVIIYYDWFGTKEGLDAWKENWEKACSENEEVKSCKHYSPNQQKWHWAYIMEVDCYETVSDVAKQSANERDYSTLTHSEIEVFREA